MIARWRRIKPRSPLDNTPLEQLLHFVVPLERLPGLIEQGCLQALAVRASSYSSGPHVTFFQGSAHLNPWTRSQRVSVRDRITYEHLLASSAIPLVFPAVALEINGLTEYIGDGSMRQTAPVAPVIHPGAERILLVGAGRMSEPREPVVTQAAASDPLLAQIAGHAVSGIFLDALAVDIERIRRINQTPSLMPREARKASTLRPVKLLVIAPSERLDQIAARHADALPPAVRSLLAALGVSPSKADVKGGALASHLLFEADDTRELLELGHADTLRQEGGVCRFFGWADAPAAAMPPPGQIDGRADPPQVSASDVSANAVVCYCPLQKKGRI